MPFGGLVVLYDIRWSEEMLEAWNRIMAGPGWIRRWTWDELVWLGSHTYPLGEGTRR